MKNTWEFNKDRQLTETREIDGNGTQIMYLTSKKDGIIINHEGVVNGTSVVGISLEALDILLWDAGYTITKRKSVFSND
jgi:hypothetical protein